MPDRPKRVNICSAVCIGADYTEDEVVWLRAVSAFQQLKNRKALTAREIISLAVSLGYRKEAGFSQLGKS